MNKKTTNTILLFLIIFFALQLLSHLFLKLGESKASGKRSGLFKWSALLMPLDGESIYRHAYALLFENVESKNNEMILKSIREFEKSIYHNVLFYRAYYYLGKAFFFYNLPNSPYFQRGVKAFKRAALIRGNKNSNIAADTLLLLLSQWPLLGEEEKKFCQDLLERSIEQVRGKDFDSILEAWRLYSQEVKFFSGILKKDPQYYLTIARELSRMGRNLEMRQNFLSAYEVHQLNWMKTTYQRYREESNGLVERLKNLYRKSNIAGYYRLTNNTDFNEKDYLEFKRTLNLHILKLLLVREELHNDNNNDNNKDNKKDNKKRKEIEQYILDYLNDSRDRNETELLGGLLKKNNFFSHPLTFSTSHFLNFYIKQLIHFKQGEYTRVIDDIERLKQSVAFVQRENLKDYTAILLLLSDALSEKKLLHRAVFILEEIEKISPGLLETYWRMKKIELMIGVDDKIEQKGDEVQNREGKFQKVKESRFIELSSFTARKTVYLVDSYEIVIHLSDKLKEKMKSRNLFQVFIGGKIYYEAYIRQLKEEVGIEVKWEESTARFEVLVKII